MLFQSLHQPRLRISEVGSWVQNSWSWTFSAILEPLLNYIAAESENLSTIMQHIVPSLAVEDWFVWWSDSNGFSIKSTFSRLYYCVEQEFQSCLDLKMALKYVWKSNVPSNIKVFVWRLLLNRLQTRDEIANRGVILGVYNLVCSLCLGHEESRHHLFLLSVL